MKAMVRSILLAMLLGLMPVASAQAACGIGSQLWEGSNSTATKTVGKIQTQARPNALRVGCTLPKMAIHGRPKTPENNSKTPKARGIGMFENNTMVSISHRKIMARETNP